MPVQEALNDCMVGLDPCLLHYKDLDSLIKLVLSNYYNMYELLNVIPFQECVITRVSCQHPHISGGTKNI